MAKSPIATDIHEALDILVDIPAKITLHLVTTHNNGADPAHLFLGQIPHPPVQIHTGRGQDLPGRG